MLTTKPTWLVKREKESHKSGTLDLSHEVVTDLTVLSSQPFLKVLDLSFQPISSLRGLPKFPQISKFIANGSSIQSYSGFDAIDNAKSVELSNTPLSKTKNFKLSAMFIFKNLSSINKKTIPRSVVTKFESYDKQFVPDLKLLICNGWEVSYPCPDFGTIAALMKEYGVINTRDNANVYKNKKGTKTKIVEGNEEEEISEQQQQDDDDDDDEPIYGEDSIMQTRSLIKTKKSFYDSPNSGNSASSSDDDSFVKNVRSITKQHQSLIARKERKFNKVLKYPMIAGQPTDIDLETVTSDDSSNLQSSNVQSSLPPSPKAGAVHFEPQDSSEQTTEDSYASESSGNSSENPNGKKKLSLRKQVAQVLTSFGVKLEHDDEQTILETLELLIERTEGKNVTLPLEDGVVAVENKSDDSYIRNPPSFFEDGDFNNTSNEQNHEEEEEEQHNESQEQQQEEQNDSNHKDEDNDNNKQKEEEEEEHNESQEKQDTKSDSDHNEQNVEEEEEEEEEKAEN